MNDPFEAMEARLSSIENLILDLNLQPKQPEPDNPISIKEVAELTRLTVPTLYGYVQRNEIPFYRKANRLYFFKSEIIENWIKSSDNYSLKEFSKNPDCYSSRTRSKGFNNLENHAVALKFYWTLLSSILKFFILLRSLPGF